MLVRNSESWKKALIFLKYFAFFVLFYILSFANINGILFPFSFGMLFALVWCNQKVLVLAPLYVLANFLNGFGLVSLLCSGVTVIVLLITYGIHFKAKKPMKVWNLFIYAFISQICYLYFQISSGVFFVIPLVNIFLGLLFMFAAIKIFSAVIIRGFAYKLTIFEIICGAFVLLAVSSGIGELAIFKFELIKLFACLVILLSAYAFNITTCIMSAGVIGLGTLLSSNNPMLLSAFVIWAFAVSAFKFKNKFLPVLAILVCEVALGLYFKIYYGYDILSLLPVVIGSFIFLLIPNKVLDELSGFFSTSADRLAMRNIVNRNRSSISRRLSELSDIFNEMNKVFRSMIQGSLTVEEAKVMLVKDIKEKICASCGENARCHRTFSQETEKIFYDFVTIAFERGKVSLLDVPPFLTSRCTRVNNIISTVNDLTFQYKKYAGMMNNLDASKVLIAEQLGGISGIMKDLSKEISTNISFDAGRENKIIDELTYNNIICSDCVIYEQNYEIMNATIIVRNDCLLVEKIEKIVSKVCGNKMAVFSTDTAPRNGWTILSVRTAPKYDVIFGSANAVKASSSISGDSYSLTRIENDKFMLALCDGMGSGVKAEKSSNLAMGLVENFYKAGFDNDIILSSVNKLLGLSNDEVFSALDLCIIDLRKGIADLIKLGAPNGFIKHEHSTDIIETSALPLGIVGEAKPYLKKIVLSAHDMIVICTDGINDSFMSPSDLSAFINEKQTSNPQLLAEEILNQALANCKNVALDDMTVLVARVFEKN